MPDWLGLAILAERAPTLAAGHRKSIDPGRDLVELELAVLVVAVRGHSVLHDQTEQTRSSVDTTFLDAGADANSGDRRTCRIEHATANRALRQIQVDAKLRDTLRNLDREAGLLRSPLEPAYLEEVVPRRQTDELVGPVFTGRLRAQPHAEQTLAVGRERGDHPPRHRLLAVADHAPDANRVLGLIADVKAGEGVLAHPHGLQPHVAEQVVADVHRPFVDPRLEHDVLATGETLDPILAVLVGATALERPRRHAERNDQGVAQRPVTTTRDQSLDAATRLDLDQDVLGWLPHIDVNVLDG